MIRDLLRNRLERHCNEHPENEPDIHAKMQWTVEELRERYERQVA